MSQGRDKVSICRGNDGVPECRLVVPQPRHHHPNSSDLAAPSTPHQQQGEEGLLPATHSFAVKFAAKCQKFYSLSLIGVFVCLIAD